MRKLALAAMCAAGMMGLAGQAAAAVVDFQDLAPGLTFGHVPTGGLRVFSYPAGFDVIDAGDPAATGTSGHEALSVLSDNPANSYSLIIAGSAFYRSIDLNGAAGETLTLQFGNDMFGSVVLDNDLSTFQTFVIPTALPFIALVIGSTSGAFTVDNIVYDRPAEWGPVPEPATWAMMLAGFGLAGAGLRRRRMRLA